MKKRICVFTGSRAEYGLLRPLIAELKKDKAFETKLLVSGTHTEREYGLTQEEIIKDGFAIDAIVKIMGKDVSAKGVSKAMAGGIIRFTETLSQWKPDLVIILGDRYEALAMAIAAMFSRIPIAHLHGGEATYGVMDESIRHAITKMSYLHFTSTESYRRRVIQLGENPKHVYNVGAIGIDNITQMKLLTREELQNKMGCGLKKHNLLITYHPATLHPGQSEEQFQVLIDELDRLKETLLIFTKSNADMEGSLINCLIEKYVKEHQEKSLVFASMGQRVYLSAMKYVDAVVGNSSSGIIEAPSLKVGTINIGDRQEGRVRAESIIDCKPTPVGIRSALKELYSVKFQQRLKKMKNLYGSGGTALKIMHRLRSLKLAGVLVKKFVDMPIS